MSRAAAKPLLREQRLLAPVRPIDPHETDGRAHQVRRLTAAQMRNADERHLEEQARWPHPECGYSPLGRGLEVTRG